MPEEKVAQIQYPHSGHRSRLRKRFLNSGFDGFLDYEILELLFSLGTPRTDCKQIAKEAIRKYKSLANVFKASIYELQDIKGIGPNNVFGIKLANELQCLNARLKLDKKVLIDSSKLAGEYLIASIGKSDKEIFFLLCLDSRGGLLSQSRISVGSLTASIVHPREVFREAMQTKAAQIIVSHNHPSGNPEPSPEDIALTRRLDEAARIVGITLIDHIVCTSDSYISMREQNLF